MKHNLLKSLIISVILLTGVSNAWASVGVACANTSDYTVKLNAKKQTDYNNWDTRVMSKAKMTFDGKKLYISDYDAPHNGFAVMQFQYHNDNGWVEEVEAFNSWQKTDFFYRAIYNYDKKDWYPIIQLNSNARLYFDATGWNETDGENIKLCIGHSNWQNYYAMQRINYTKLFYINPDQWADARGFGVVGNTTASSGQNWLTNVSEKAKEFTGFINYDLISAADNNAYLMVNKGKSGEQPEMSYYESHYSLENGLNSTQTIKYSISREGSTYSTLTSGTTPATINISSYKFVDKVYNSVNSETKTWDMGSSSYTQQFIAARTATTTLTVSNIETGYKFDGWYDAATGGNKLFSDPTYTYYPTEAKTVYARFSEDNIFVVRGDEQFGDTWGSDVNVMTKKNEFEQIVYYTVSITGRNLEESNTAYQFKIYDKTTDKWYGLAADDMHFWYTRDMGEQNLVEGDAGKNIELRADVPGEYVIKVDYSDETKPKITITYPEKHTVTLYPVSDSQGNSFGHFTVEHQGTRYTSSATENVTFEVAKGSTITIVESQHNHPEVFNGDLDVNINGERKNIKNPVGKQIIVNTDGSIAENFVVRKEAVINKNLHLFLKIPKYLDKKDKGNEVVEWRDNDSNDGDAADGYSAKAEDCANFVWLGDLKYLEQEIQGSTEEERGCPGTGQPEGSYLMKPLTIEDNYYNYYYCTITDSCWINVKFERKHADSDPGQGQLMAAEVQRFAGDDKVCFRIEEHIDGRGFVGVWEEAPKCTVTLGYCEFGTYAIEYNGQKYFAQQPKQEVKIPVAFGEKIKILEGQPASNAYSGGTILDALNPDPEFRALNINEEIIVKKDFTVDDNFVTKGEHVVYLGVPTSLSDWKASEISNQQADEFAYYIWRQNRLGWLGMEDEFDKSCEYLYEDNGIRYYKFRIKAGCYAFQFQRKNNDRSSGNGTFAQSQTLYFQIPLDNVNCYTLRDEKSDDTHYLGSWGILPPRPGDYRLLYAEKKLIKTHEEGESEDWETAFRTIDSHPSDVIRKRPDLNTGKDTVSLHIYTQRAYDTIPMVILQQYQTVNSTNQWVDIEAHTVLPLKAHGNMGMLPGRKKAYGELPFYSDGIDAIKDDLVDKGSGVWNFIVEQAKDENTKNMTTTLHLGKDKLKRYEGTYYIRTTNTLGGWINYYNEDNHMKFSSYSKQYRGFSHYYCKWVDITKHSKDVRFVVANDYGSAISKELIADTYSNSNGEITENANIRWSWNIVDNKVSRAYIQGTWNTNSVRLDNIVAKYKTRQSASDSRELLDDTGDWIYSKDIKNVQVGSQLVSLTAQYPSDGDTQIFAEDMDMLIGEIEHNQNKYVVRILYDFKIDKTMVTLVPDENNADIAIDVLIERIDQGEATQVRSNINTYKTITNANGETETGATVYAMMTFNKAHLTNPSLSLSDQRRFTYWISFPFDVNIADVFGFSEYGKQWRIRTYDSQARAENGYDGTQTYWKYIDINQTPVLEANKGYILVLNAKLRNPEHSAYTNRSSLSLYFPSANLINDLDTACIETPVVVPRNEGQAPSKDWNWNMIGVPSYANKDRTISQDHLYYFFEYNLDNDSYEVCWAGKEQTFKSMFAYMVQFAGTIDWTNFKVNSGQFPEQLAAKKDASAEINHVMRLELLRNNQREDKTYIQLTENENATEQFDMNFDLTKMANAKANLYSLIGNHQLAANVLPLQTTVVPLGVIIKTAGEYTFSMPDGTDGIIAELIDYQTNTRTNLLLDNYTVTLPAGTNNSRFALSLQPDKTVTSVDNIGNEATGDKVKKYLIDGKLYLQKDGVLYDAQGHAL